YRADADLRERDVHLWYRRPVIRQDLLQGIRSSGYVEGFTADIVAAGGEVISCQLDARGVYDDHGVLTGSDEVWRCRRPGSKKRVSKPESSLVLTLDPQGRLIDLKGGTLEQIDFNSEVLRGRLVSDLVRMENPHLLDLFLAGVLDNKRAKGVISLVDKSGRQRQINFSARLIQPRGKSPRIECVVRDPWVAERACDINQAKFDGVREMAGGIAHRLNQPLMVLNNRVGEVLSLAGSQDQLRGKLTKIQEILTEINEIARKVADIKTYAPMDYVGGIKIVDIDQSALKKN
ncbi:MAG: hypothetical protein WBG37_03335, partial [Desulfobacterales bacterium]